MSGERVHAWLDVLAHNWPKDSLSPSPAVVGTEMILRGEQHLCSIAAKIAPD
jgi:hypothetical protein